MDLPVFNIGDPDLVANVERQLNIYRESNFTSFKKIGLYLDRHFEVMKAFLQGLKQA
jgi:hypothetical protein